EKAVSVLQPKALPTASEIRQACTKVMRRVANSIVDGRKSIDRENFRDHIDEFLASEQRYFIVLGPSGVGKSISAATDAKRLNDAGKTVLLVKGKHFSLEQAAKLISQEIWPSVTALSWQKVVEILAENESTETPGFV